MPNTFKLLSKWRNLAKYGHTDEDVRFGTIFKKTFILAPKFDFFKCWS